MPLNIDAELEKLIDDPDTHAALVAVRDYVNALEADLGKRVADLEAAGGGGIAQVAEEYTARYGSGEEARTVTWKKASDSAETA